MFNINEVHSHSRSHDPKIRSLNKAEKQTNKVDEMAHRSITLSVPPFADWTIVVPKLKRSEPPSLCLLTRPECDKEEGPGSDEDCMMGVEGKEGPGESCALSRPLRLGLGPPMSDDTRSSTSTRREEVAG